MTSSVPFSHYPPFDRSALRTGLLLFLWLGLLAAIAIACASREATIDERAYALDRQLMCPVCDGQTVDQSNAQVSLDMKGVIREKLRAGESENEILDYFAARYGDAVPGIAAHDWILDRSLDRAPCRASPERRLPGRHHAANEKTRNR